MKWLLLVLMCGTAMASPKPKVACSTFYSVVTRDRLGNITQGASDKEYKKIATDLAKKYPDICYVEPDPSVKVVFFIAVVPATYNGQRTVTNTSNTSGSVSTSGGDYGTYDGTTTSTSTAPYSFEYGRYMLTVEILNGHNVTVKHRFQQDGIFRTLYGILLGGRGHHPDVALIEDAVKWVSSGGLTDPLQSTQ